MAERKFRRILWRVGRLIGLVVVCIFAFVALFQRHFIFFPMSELETTPGEAGLDYEDVALTVEDGTALHAWFVPASRSRGTVLFFHGNAGNVSHRMPSILAFGQMGLDVLIVDYRGYGRSEGTPSEDGVYADAMAGWKYLTETRGIAPQRIIIFGRSLGGAVAAKLASQTNAAGLALESAFTSIPDLASDIYPLLPIRFLLRYDLATVEYVAQAGCPVLVAHSPDDDLIPYDHGKRIYAAAAEPKQFLDLSGGHNDRQFLFQQTYTDAWEEFLSRCGLNRPGQ